MSETGQIKIFYDDGLSHDSVKIAGEFTSWEPVDLGVEEGTLYAAIFDGAQPGEYYQYKFIVDGAWTLHDGYEQAQDAIGNYNHVVKALPVPIALGTEPTATAPTPSETAGGQLEAENATVGSNETITRGDVNGKDIGSEPSTSKPLAEEEPPYEKESGSDLPQSKETSFDSTPASYSYSRTVPVTLVDVQRSQRVGGDGPWQVVDQQQDVIYGERSPEIVEPVDQSSEPAEPLRMPSSAESAEPIAAETVESSSEANDAIYATTSLATADTTSYIDADETFQRSGNSSAYDSAVEYDTPAAAVTTAGTQAATPSVPHADVPTSSTLPTSQSFKTITPRKEISLETGAPHTQIDESTGFPPEVDASAMSSPLSAERGSAKRASYSPSSTAAAAASAATSPSRKSAANTAAARASAYAKYDVVDTMPPQSSAEDTPAPSGLVSNNKRLSGRSAGSSLGADGEGILSQAQREIHQGVPPSEGKSKFRNFFRRLSASKR